MGRPVIVAGAGLAGSLMAILCGRRGHEVLLLERRDDPRAAGFAGGRSINLAISRRGLDALARAGLAERVLAGAVPMRGRMIHDPAGRLRRQPYGPLPEHHLNSVSRAGLNRLLIDEAERTPGVTVRFSSRCAGADLDRPAAIVEDAAGSRVTVDGSALIGADGAFSAVRRRMQRSGRFDFAQSFLDHGYKELTIPPAPGGGFRMEPEALHIWPRERYMMIALPNADGSFTCTLFLPFEGEVSFAAVDGPPALRRFFERSFPDAIPLLPDLEQEFFEHPTGSLVTIRCGPWHRGRTVLIGDAAHAVVPFYGQGANAAFEDCLLLDDELERCGGDFAAAFARFSLARKPHADALADLALANYIEMRDHTASRLFVARTRAEQLLHRLLGRAYLPLYTMVTFTRIPYADAVRRARRQRIALDLSVLGALAGAALLLIRLLR